MIGKEILGYRVDEKIGSGGFGTVYKVSKTNAAGTYVRALKHITLPTKKQYASVLNSMGGDYAKADDYFASALSDIVNEIKILSMLSESGVKNIVRYYENDIIETESPKTYDIYIMMEFLTPFSDYVESRSFTVGDVITLGKDILRALVSCHEKKIIHRDIKDDNIFVSSDGSYKIGDFGISKALKDKSRAESVKGTPNFIAPEVYLGKEKYDSTVDLYSLGIVLYKLLNKMRNPFMPRFPEPYSTADEDAAFEARMTGQIPELPLCAQNELGKAVLKAIMPRAERYNSAREFLDALEEAERNMTDEELAAVICEVLMKNENESVKEVSVDAQRSAASDETLGMVYSPEAEEESVSADRNLFETFSKDPAPVATPEAKKNSTLQSPDETFAVNPAPDAAPEVKKTESAPQARKDPAEERRETPAAIPVSSNDTASDKKPDLRRLLTFIIPPALLLTCIAFYAILLPVLYGSAVSFFSWLFADVGNLLKLAEGLKNTGAVWGSIYGIIILLVVQYVLIASFIGSLFFLARELHAPKKTPNASVRYTGKLPRMMLENALVTLKNNLSVFGRDTVGELNTVIDSMKYGKDFGDSKDVAIVDLENEICGLIDELQSELSQVSDESATKVSALVKTIKQKNLLRDSMLKK